MVFIRKKENHPNDSYTIPLTKKFLEKKKNSHPGAAEINPTRNHEVAGLVPGLAQWVNDLVLL